MQEFATIYSKCAIKGTYIQKKRKRKISRDETRFLSKMRTVIIRYRHDTFETSDMMGFRAGGGLKRRRRIGV